MRWIGEKEPGDYNVFIAHRRLKQYRRLPVRISDDKIGPHAMNSYSTQTDKQNCLIRASLETGAGHLFCGTLAATFACEI